MRLHKKIIAAMALGLLSITLSACAMPKMKMSLGKSSDSVSHTIIPELVKIPKSTFFMGSEPSERERAYQIDEEAYRVPVTRQQQWYEYEIERETRYQHSFQITKYPITNAQYAAFVKETGHQAPDVDIVDWQSYHLNMPFSVTQKYRWTENGYATGREMHPVVLVSYHDALAYAAWLREKTGKFWRLPTEQEWELAARGIDGRAYPWGNHFNPALANTADTGPHDTLPVGLFPRGASPFGVMDMAGQVYEWTSTPGEKGRMTLKGGAWDDRGCGICRAAARHHRHKDMKHVIIGFRLVMDVDF